MCCYGIIDETFQGKSVATCIDYINNKYTIGKTLNTDFVLSVSAAVMRATSSGCLRLWSRVVGKFLFITFFCHYDTFPQVSFLFLLKILSTLTTCLIVCCATTKFFRKLTSKLPMIWIPRMYSSHIE